MFRHAAVIAVPLKSNLWWVVFQRCLGGVEVICRLFTTYLNHVNITLHLVVGQPHLLELYCPTKHDKGIASDAKCVCVNSLNTFLDGYFH